MSDTVGSLLEMFKNGSVTVDRGGVLAIHNGKPIEGAIAWLQANALARLDKNVGDSSVGGPIVFFGQPNTVMVEVVPVDADICYTHLSLRVFDETLRGQVSTLLEKDGFFYAQGNSVISGPIWFSSELGFAVRVVVRAVAPQDPAVTDGTGHSYSERQEVDEASDSPP